MRSAGLSPASSAVTRNENAAAIGAAALIVCQVPVFCATRVDPLIAPKQD
jgi:hypothetical protein